MIPMLETIVTYLLTNVLPPVVEHLLGAIIIIVFGGWIMRAIRRGLVVAARQSHVKPALIDLLGALVTIAGWLLIVGGVLQALNLNELAIAVGGSISMASLGVAAAASGKLADIIAGVFLASDPDFGTGFVVKSSEIEGTIERIDLRKTRIRGNDGKLHIVPNRDIESKVWIVEQRPAPEVHAGGGFHIPSSPSILPPHRGGEGAAPRPSRPSQPDEYQLTRS